MACRKLVQPFQFRRHHRRFVVHGCLAPFGNQDPAGCQPPNNHREVWKEFFRSPELVRVIDPSADVAKQPVTPAERFFVNMVSRSLVQGFNARMIRGNLTLALSPGEREPPSAGCGVAMAGATNSDSRRPRNLRPILPLFNFTLEALPIRVNAELETSAIGQVFSTSMNASCGMLTVPNDFIRFLPSFCFSSSLRLRVMSPP